MLGAAVLDDIVGLVILSVVSSVVGGVALTLGGITLTTAIALGFVVAAVVLGRFLVPPVFRAIASAEASVVLGVAGVVFALILGLLAEKSGSAAIIGAFAAGLILHPTPQRTEIEKSATQLGHFFVRVDDHVNDGFVGIFDILTHHAKGAALRQRNGATIGMQVARNQLEQG